MQENHLVPHIVFSQAVSTRPLRSDASPAKLVRSAINSPAKSSDRVALTPASPVYNSSNPIPRLIPRPIPSPTPSSKLPEPKNQSGETKKGKKGLWGIFSKKPKGALRPANVNTMLEMGKFRSTPNLLDMQWSHPPLLEPQTDISDNASSHLAPKTPASFLPPPSPIIYFGIDDIWDGETSATDVTEASLPTHRGRSTANLPTDISDNDEDDFDEPSSARQSARNLERRQRVITSRSHTNRWAINLGMD